MPERPPAKFEFGLLEFLARHDRLTVRDIFEQFGKPQGYIRGTVVKGVDRLLKKGLVERELVDGVYQYRSKQAAEDLERQLVESFIRDRLHGRLKPIASFLSEGRGIDPQELKELKKLLDEIEE
jgi:BlaI family transcriptional regulator, penicillinase repressor